MNNKRGIILPNQRSPYDYQLEDAKTCSLQDTILALDAGLGKTLTSLMAAMAWQHRTGNKTIVVIAPPTVVKNWSAEAEGLIDPSNLLVFSTGKIPAPVIGNPYFLIIDEAHYMQNHYSVRTKKAYRLAENADRVLLLTATPIRNYSANLFPLLHMIRRYDIASDYQAYLRQFCNGKPNGNSNTAQLYQSIKNSIIIRKKEQVLNLPELKPQLLSVKFTGSMRTYFEKVISDLKKEYREKIASGESTGKMKHLVMLQKLRQASSLAKSNYAAKLAKKYLEKNEQVIIFANYLDTIEKVSDMLKEYPQEVLTGSDSHKQRSDKANRFQAGESKVWIATMQASGVGVNLFKGTIVIFIDRSFSPADLEQAQARAHRIGQSKRVLSFILQDTVIDNWVDTILMHKHRAITHALSGRPEEMIEFQSGIDYQAEILEHVF